MELFYCPDPNSTHCILTGQESVHCHRVMRKKEGDPIWITDGKGQRFECVIEQMKKDQVICRIQQTQSPGKHWQGKISLVVSPLQQPARFEWLLEKATEIGVDEIYPVICERSSIRKLNSSRYDNLLISAMKQSAQSIKPVMHEVHSFSEFFKSTLHYTDKFIAICDPLPKNTLSNKIAGKQQIMLWIGPEGDFTSIEISTALQQGWEPVQLGQVRLRAETAAICALHTFHCHQQHS